MRTYLLAFVFILLLALLPGCAAKQSAPSWPWKVGDEVLAELVTADSVRGILDCLFITPNGEQIYLTFDSSNSDDDSPTPFCIDCPNLNEELEEALDDKNMGLPMLIRIEKNIKIVGHDEGQRYYVKASSIIVSKEPCAPRYQWVIPNQTLTGKIVCEGEPGFREIFMFTEDNTKVRISAGYGDARRFLPDFCSVVGKITIEGEFIFDKGVIQYFRTTSISQDYPPFTSEE